MKGKIDTLITEAPFYVSTVFSLKTWGFSKNDNFQPFNCDNVSFSSTAVHLLSSLGYVRESEWCVKNSILIDNIMNSGSVENVETKRNNMIDLIMLHVLSTPENSSVLYPLSLRSMFPFWKIKGSHYLEQLFTAAADNNNVSETVFIETINPTLPFRSSPMLTVSEALLKNYHHMLTMSLKILQGKINTPVNDDLKQVHLMRLEEYCKNSFDVSNLFKGETLENYPLHKTPRSLGVLYYSKMPSTYWAELLSLPEEWLKKIGS
jgi:hypothetical protein